MYIQVTYETKNFVTNSRKIQITSEKCKKTCNTFQGLGSHTAERDTIPTAEMIYRWQDIAGGNGYDLCQVGFELCFMQTDILTEETFQIQDHYQACSLVNMSVSEGFRESEKRTSHGEL